MAYSDIILILILLLLGAKASRKGLIRSLLGTISWIFILIASYFLQPVIRKALGGFLISSNFQEPGIGSSVMDDLLGNNSLSGSKDGVITRLIETFNSSSTLAAYAYTCIAIFIIVYLITRMFSKKYQHNIIGALDGFLGFVFGVAEGILISCLLLIILPGIIKTFSPDTLSLYTDDIKASVLCRWLMVNNPILHFKLSHIVSIFS